MLHDVDREGVFKEESEQIIKKIKSNVNYIRDNKCNRCIRCVPLVDIFKVIFEIKAGLTNQKKQQLNDELNKLMVDSHDGLDYVKLKVIINKLKDGTNGGDVQNNINYLNLCIDLIIDDSDSSSSKYEAETML